MKSDVGAKPRIERIRLDDKHKDQEEQTRPAAAKPDIPTILVELDAIVVARLFGTRPWFANKESGPALQRIVMRMGLEEQVTGEKDTWQSTSLGKQIHLDVIMVFLGLWE